MQGGDLNYRPADRLYHDPSKNPVHSIAHFNSQSGELGRHPGYAVQGAPPTMLALRPPQALIRLAPAWRLEDSLFMLKCCSLRLTYSSSS